ncbi:magnesium transporter ALR1 [Aspergillus lentulus]|uniref:Magnesium transporter ALR1 n=1 Tax=Aspergillus lentulus TaxID=293939 RepID=A0AAN4PM17_ASPLE|nr:hypothetical protein CNMCM6069_000978 [Aspergillus lentulus]KAF4161894.1 hypothetical protein CNMCM6936_002873 [Aspergillus lentulus]KAF4173156.1 hypothetical protein CNMCM8060_000511 [Aspergillus lentulus]KAF4180806.1 hypothetical protein CNMCM7927_001045 [Aspergillus lentulus]KAF4191024.1 hypothetical protein CNMCM8694_002546 [Aspergillus lentulus]
MSESPKSEKYMCLTRFSTPVPELDDHRFQLDSPPRIEATADISLSRQNTTQHAYPQETPQRPDLLSIQDALREAGSLSRDFEQAILDDDRSGKDVNTLGRRFSVDLTGNVRHGRTWSRTHQELANISRESSPSARSSSPPNSVEAFADPRRRERANTLESHAAPDLEAILQRTVSGGTHPRRPTFSNASAIRPQPGDIQLEPSDETCVPTYEQPGRIPVIDYEELEEFVALSRQMKPSTTRRVRKSDVEGEKRSSSADRSCSDLMDADLKTADKVYANVVDGKDIVEKLQNENEPTRFGFFSSESQSTVHAAELGDLVLPGDTFRDLFQLGPEGGVWWLDVLNPTEEEVAALSRAFSIHPLTTEDILTQEAREKVELFKQYYFVCFRTFYQLDKTDERFMEPVNFYMVVFRDGVLSFSFTENPHAANVRKRIGKLRDYVSLSSDWICYAMIDDIVDSFGPVIREIEIESEAIEDLVFIARVDDFESFLPRIGGLRKKVMSLMRLLGGKADVIRGFSKRCNEQYSVTPRGDIGLYLGDIQDHVVTMMSNLAHFEKMLSRSHTNYLAQLNVTNLVLGNHVNKVLSKVTLIATMLVPMNLICGLFGMNVRVPGEGQEGLGWFFGIVGVIAAVIVLSGIAARNDTNVIYHDIAEQFTFPHGSYSGLEVQDTVSENGETRGLDLIRRVPPGVSSLGNNQFKTSDIKLGETQWWYFPKESVNGKKSNVTSGLPERISVDGTSQQTVSSDELRKRDGDIVKRSTSVYLSLTMCSKPEINNTNGTIPDSVPSLPELNLYVSTSESLQKPGPGQDSSKQEVFTANEGYVGASVQADGDIFIGVAVQNSTAYSGGYTYEIAASIDAYFHSVVDEPFLHFVDADIHAALLTTDNLTLSEEGSENYQQWMNLTPPFTMFAHNVNDTAISGLQRSYCALEQLAQIREGDHGVEGGMTNRGLGKKPKEQFYITGLNRTSNYSGILAMDGNSTNSGNGIVGGGGRVWKPMYFATKSDDNCAVLFNLTFCSEVAYAVPSNPDLGIAQLGAKYDKYAESLYKNFSYSLDQIQCNATNETSFSLAVSCNDCADAYKQWLCAVTIPRCADFSSNGVFLQVRNAGQQFINGSSLSPTDPRRRDPAQNKSRNSMIDDQIRPGPYKEILPCQDICYSLVKRCPAALGFSCPQGTRLNSAYGQRGSSSEITCSYPGAAYDLNAGRSLREPLGWLLLATGSFWFSFWALRVDV